MRSLIVVLLFYLLVGCNDDETTRIWPDPLEGLPNAGPLKFDAPAIGQRSYYISFRGVKDGTSETVRYEHTNDTIVLAITGTESNRWIVKEYLTPGSDIRQAAGEDASLDSVFVTRLMIDTDSIYFGDPTGAPYYSYLFAISKNDFFSLPMSLIDEPATQNPSCSPFIARKSDEMQYALGYTLFGQTFDHLNIYPDNSMTATDGPALMYVYAPEYGIVRMSVINPMAPERATGWDLVSR